MRFFPLILLFLTIITPAFSKPLILQDCNTSYSAGKSLQYFLDKKSTLSSINALELLKKNKYQNSQDTVLNFGYTKATVWLSIKVINKSSEESWLIDFPYALFDEIDVFSVYENAITRIYHGGRLRPLKKNSRTYRAFKSPVTLSHNKVYHFLVRINSEDSLPAPVYFTTLKTFYEKESNSQLLLGMYYGLVLIIILYYFFIFISTGDLTNLYYAFLLTVLHLFFQLSLNGILKNIVPFHSEWVARKSIAFFISMGLFWGLSFSGKFLKIEKYSPAFSKIFQVWSYLQLIVAMMTFWGPYYYMIQICVVLSMGGAAAMMAGGWACYRQGYKPARYYLLSWIFLTGLGWFYGLKTLGLMRSNFFTEYSFQIGMAMQVLILSLAMADLIHFLRKKSYKAQKETLQIKDKMNQELEEKVQLRTAELLVALEETEKINEELIQTRDQLWGEMILAKKIQTVLLPEKPLIEGYEISAHMTPADEVGGDYYDVINAGGFDWLVIGDVSGHGVPAGLIMMMVQTSIHVVLSQNPEINPSELLSLINRTITRNIQQLNEDKYMTITVISAIKNGSFSFAGLHQDILVYRAAEENVEYYETSGVWIGIMDDISGMLNDERLIVEKDDVMLLYTDGITEAWVKGSVKDHRDPEFDMYGQNRLVDVLRKNGKRPLEDIKKNIIGSLEGYNCSDDVTFLIIKRL